MTKLADKPVNDYVRASFDQGVYPFDRDLVTTVELLDWLKKVPRVRVTRENDVANARVLEESDMDTSTAHLLTKVTIRNMANSMEMTYSIVSEAEADLAVKKISVTSPIGKGLLGKSVGELVDIEVPNGIRHFEIIKIERL